MRPNLARTELLVVADLHFEKGFGLWGDGDVSPAV